MPAGINPLQASTKRILSDKLRIKDMECLLAMIILIQFSYDSIFWMLIQVSNIDEWLQIK